MKCPNCGSDIIDKWDFNGVLFCCCCEHRWHPDEEQHKQKCPVCDNELQSPIYDKHWHWCSECKQGWNDTELKTLNEKE